MNRYWDDRRRHARVFPELAGLFTTRDASMALIAGVALLLIAGRRRTTVVGGITQASRRRGRIMSRRALSP
jgi:hypothetical protein